MFFVLATHENKDLGETQLSSAPERHNPWQRCVPSQFGADLWVIITLMIVTLDLHSVSAYHEFFIEN